MGLPASSPIALVLVAGLMAAPAMAAPPAQVQPTETLSFADLDLTSATDAAVMLTRIEKVALRVCGPEPVASPLTPRAVTLYRQCVDSTVATTVADISAPMLTALHNQESPAGAVLASR
jgi:UrcA family protein